MNIGDSNELRACTSCQMCAAVCPKNAILIRLNHDGFYRPYIDRNLCIDCGLCVKVCYKFDSDIKITPDSFFERAPLYAASLHEGDISKTTSGGVADLLAKTLLANGYICVGVKYDLEHNSALHKFAYNYEQAKAFRGSKYIQSYTFPAFRELIQCCTSQKIAVFGTPCQIYAIRKYLILKGLRNRVVLIDLYCHGCPSLYLWRKYIKEIDILLGEKKFDSVNFRDKVKGWGHYNIVLKYRNANVFISSPRKNEFYTLFFSNHILNDACSDCKLRSTLAYTDIRLGDFWGRKYLSNSRGVSAVSPVTEIGRYLFDSIRDKLNIQKHLYKDFLPYQSYSKVYSINSDLRRKMLDSLLENRPLRDTVRLFYKQQDFKVCVKHFLKDFIYYLPDSVERFLKRIVY